MPTGHCHVELVPVGELRPSTYNPRRADEHRLDLVELSLRKLGWLLPIYAHSNGEILSGHQRHLVARRMGAEHVPLVRVPHMDLNRRKAVNVLFNRATNDFARADSSQSVTRRLEQAREEITALAGSLPDFDVRDPAWFRCVEPELVPTMDLCRANRRCWIRYAKLTARSLHTSRLAMPLVVGPDDRVCNGIGRLEVLAEKKIPHAQVVRVSDDEARLAVALLNWLSMDFSIESRYADVLRHNSFRRNVHRKKDLGVAFYFDGFGDHTVAGNVNLDDPTVASQWKAHYGRTALDFGAGHLEDTERLRAIGVDCVPFEPFRLAPGTTEIDPGLGRELTREFLARVADGTRFTSVFQNSIMNSVPFRRDREHVVTVIAALCSPTTVVHVCAASYRAERWQRMLGREARNASAQTLTFTLDYEPGVTLGDFNSKPKVQKFHHPDEWRELWATGFDAVHSREIGNSLVGATCRNPKLVDPGRLRDALEFEFDLPYPDGSRMGLVDEAKDAFTQRLGVAI